MSHIILSTLLQGKKEELRSQDYSYSYKGLPDPESLLSADLVYGNIEVCEMLASAPSFTELDVLCSAPEQDRPSEEKKVHHFDLMSFGVGTRALPSQRMAASTYMPSPPRPMVLSPTSILYTLLKSNVTGRPLSWIPGMRFTLCKFRSSISYGMA